MMGVLTEKLIDLIIDTVRDKVKTSFELQKIHIALNNYFSRKLMENEVCSLDEEIDFEGLVLYIQLYFVEDMQLVLFGTRDEREHAWKRILDTAQTYAHSHTQISSARVTKMMIDVRSILEDFCRSALPQEYRYLVGEAVDEIATAVDISKTEIVSRIADSNDQITRKIDILINCLEKNHLNVSDVRHSLYEETEEYYNAWTDSMFLHPDNGKLTLGRIYQPPQYIDSKYTSLRQRLQAVIDCSDDPKNRGLIILGQPGSGKSTLITYLLNRCLISQNRVVRVFRFRNIPGIDWNDNVETLPIEILKAVDLNETDLSNSVLILDGLDEVNMTQHHCDFLNILFRKWVKSGKLRNFSLLVTCRQNRLKTTELNKLQCSYLELAPLQAKQIDNFTEIYYGITGERQRLKPKLVSFDVNSVLGIPIILYMVLSTGIEIESSSTMTEIYEKLFSLTDEEHSIYFRPQEKVSLGLNKKALQIHDFSKRVAVTIWDKHPEEEYIEHELAQDIFLEMPQNEKLTLHDLLAGQYFIEDVNEHEVRFVHRSMYEYFVAVVIRDAIQAICNVNPSNIENLFIDQSDTICQFANLVGIHDLSDYREISEYLFTMLDIPHIETQHVCTWWEEFFKVFLKKGLADVTTRHKGGLVGIREECNRCLNLIQIIKNYHEMLKNQRPYEITLDGRSIEMLGQYTRIAESGNVFADISLIQRDLGKIDLHGVQMAFAKMNGVKLEGAHLEGIHLERAQLQDAHLEYTHLQYARLQKAKLNGAHLEHADLREANLTHTELKSAKIEHADLTGACLKGAYLPDNYKSNNQEDQIEHLKWMNIEGLII